ncbi:hypothetical protein GIW70_07670 [Pseudomonas syringae]|nr:hypothetical protein [Pseudomonas syringae]MCF5068074.1 hypothetical protein [Pseudomonas syringae]
MNNPIIQGNKSLVLNGDFRQAMDFWEKGPINASWLGVATEEYESVLTSFLKAGNRSSVSQEFKVPKNPGAQASYSLSFLCETQHTLPGTMTISVVGNESEQLTIELMPGAERDLEEDQARIERGLPRVYKPIKYECPLLLAFTDQQSIKIEVKSPINDPGDFLSAIRITHIRISLNLAPVALQGWKLDSQPARKDEPLYLCLGASGSFSHQLRFELDPDSAWTGTQAALTLSDELSGIVATPEWDQDHPLNAPWSLDCPYLGDEEPYLFTMNLVNEYTADPYPIEVSLGHHCLIFREWQEAAYYPVLEYGQSVRLGVLVASYYTGKPVEGRTVRWSVAGQAVEVSAITGADGWAYFDYTPDIAGTFDVQASVDSAYYESGVYTETTVLRVLATDPWKELMAVSGGIEARWEEKTGYPNRGTSYPVDVKLPVDSPLLGSAFSLHWNGDSPEQLGVFITPALGDPVLIDQVNTVWTLINEDRLDGRFELSLVCSKLLLPSPKKPMSLARNLVEIGEVREANKFPVVDEQESVLLRVQVLHVTSSGPGEPVSNALVDWQTPEHVVSTVTGAGGWASLLYSPTSAGNMIVTAGIRAHEDAVPIEHAFDVEALATSPWKTEVQILLDGEAVDHVAVGLLCWRGGSHRLKVLPISDTLIGEPLTLDWRGADPAIGLTVKDIGVAIALPAEGVEWPISSEINSVSSLFDLKLSTPKLSTDRELFGRLVAPDLDDEFTVYLDQVWAPPGAQMYPCLGAHHRHVFVPNALSPLVGLSAKLGWSGTPADELNAGVEPALDQLQTIEDGGARWLLDFSASAAPGLFSLALELPQLQKDTVANPMNLAHNRIRIEASREASVDPVIGQAPAWLWLQVFSHYTAHAVEHVPVTWLTQKGSVEVPTDANGWAGFAFEPNLAGTQDVSAEIASRYDDFVHKRTMPVTVLASDPWAGLLVSFDGMLEQPWGEKTYFPRRKGQHRIEFSAEKDSPLVGRELTLGLTGTGPAELGLRFSPSTALGMPRPFLGSFLEYEFEGGDIKDGGFALRLGAERLASLSPANAMSLGVGDQVLKILVGDTAHQTLDWGQVLEQQVSVTSSITGKPMSGWRVTWRSPDLGDVTSITDFYGVARVRFTPTTPGAAQLVATVGEGGYAASVSISYALNHPRDIQDLTSPQPSWAIGEKVTAFAIVVSAMTGEPLENVEVRWDVPDRVIPPTFTNADGVAEISFYMPGRSPTLVDAVVTGGYVGWVGKTIALEVRPTASDRDG